jgi:hypothetical protein
MARRASWTAALLAVAVCALGASARADWKQDVRAKLGPTPDYEAARQILLDAWPNAADEDRGSAALLLAYVSARQKKPEDEWSWIETFFETCGEKENLFTILDDWTHQAVMSYLTSWSVRYPRVLDIAFAAAPNAPAASPPRELALGVDMGREAYFKVADDRGPLIGGRFHKGWNVLSLATPSLEEAGTIVYTLDLKAGDVSIRKKIRLDVDLKEENVAPAVPSDQTPAAGAGAASNDAAELRNRGYTLSLYLEDQLILSGTKFPTRTADFHINLPPPFPDGYKPWLPPNRQNPTLMNSASILDAVGVIANLIKSLLAKKKKEPAVVKIPKTKERSFAFLRYDKDGRAHEVRVRLTLQY